MVIAAARGGFARFGKETLAKSDYRPNIVFMSVQYQGEHKRLPILNSGKLIVPAEKRNLTVYFSALEYKDNDLVEYAFRLEGLDDDWNYVGAVNNASLSHLSAGKYRLLVKSTNSDGVEVDNIAELEIEVEPTFWETGWAKLIYILLLCMAVYLVFYVYNLNNRSRMERKLNDMKTRFFTDISHKLRTPLTLIGGPVAEVLNSKGLPDGVRGHLEMVQRNASQMLELVNQMLKYSMERGVYISDEEVPQASVLSDTVDEDIKADEEPVAGESTSGSSSRSTLLVVEDNADLRTFLVGILSNEYNVLQAENGKMGLEIAQKEMPDFIITDVMMPVMDGLTMVKKIKKDNNICHIPIIVLSAKASMEDRIEGLKSGIDDYITKPFSATYLKLRVSNIISHRRMMQQTYVEQLKPEDRKTYKLDAPEIVNADNEMMKTLMDFLEKRIDDPELKIEELADAVHLGRSVFYGKIKSIVGMTPVDFVRHIRMQRAEELISKSDYSFSQIAYMVGFSDPKYFSKCFKKETGMTPSEYRAKAE
ncbi:MAG: response regulator [Prevotella sp.]|nr:response regulator [Prevotella sp.]